MVVRSFPACRLAAALVLATLACAAGAQSVYRIVGPDGKVTYSDKPPADPATKASPTAVTPLTGTAGGLAGLPFELRQVASRYPVTLYTGPDCGPCGTGRAYLASRGIPFTEKTVSTQDDISALQRLSGASSLPFVTIGGQQLTGYSEGEWGQFLTAAGYPRSSQLPSSYRQPAATPLVAAATPKAAPAPTERPSAVPSAAAPAPSGSNPAGIQF
ncbi:glutaredoxin family protein [Ramlibacter sp. MMS24-I3-19]|uniref:glutaredoxin family protein n=1 Tax=Ramlibacter sp. MMS24-I3-19 TaxID=3416606 RepID=UPI003D009D30